MDTKIVLAFTFVSVFLCTAGVAAVSPGTDELVMARQGDPGEAMLIVEKMATSISVRSEHFRLSLDQRYGGTISSFQLFDGSRWNELFDSPERGFPDLIFQNGEQEFRISLDSEATLSEPETIGRDIHVTVDAVLRSPDGEMLSWRVRLNYTICPEGAVFVDFVLTLPAGISGPSDLSVRFDVGDAVRQFPRFRDDNLAKQGNSFPSARVAFGADSDHSFTNEVEVFVEHKRPLSGQSAFRHDNHGHFWWRLSKGAASVEGPVEYANTLSLGVGAAVDGLLKSNVIGQRVFHWVNWLDLEHWYPTNEQIDKMAEAGATMLILHMEWMRQRGSNGKPHADYREARDPEAMRSAIAYAHEKGLKVGLYMRGIEPYALDTDFFEQYCTRDRDGLYMDWHGPAAISWHETMNTPEDALGDSHYTTDGSLAPAKAYFQFTRRLREIVGPQGFLIGHQGSFNSGVFANLCFDAYLPGETGSDRRMFSDIAEAGYKGMTGGSVCMPWTLDLPAYRNAEGAAKMAAWGFYPHLVMGLPSEHEEGLVFNLEADAPEYAFIRPYWRLLSSIDMEKAQVYNLPGVNRAALSTSNPSVQGVVYKAEDMTLVIAANLGAVPVAATLELDTDFLGMAGEYRVRRINASTGEAQSTGVTERKILTSVLAPWGLEGFLLSPP